MSLNHTSLKRVYQTPGLASLILFAFCLLPLISSCQSKPRLTHKVTIHLIDELSQSPIAGNTIEIFSLDASGTPSEKTLAQLVTNNQGDAEFLLPPGTYRVQPAGSYTGFTDFSLNSDLTVTLRALPVVN